MPQSLHSITLLVRDYDEAISYFTLKLGFSLADDFPLSEEKRWIRVVPRDSSGPAILLARASTPSQEKLIGKQTGGRVAFFLRTDDFWSDYKKMKSQGVAFTEEPRKETYGTVVVFRDLCGNKWDLVQPQESEIPQRSNTWSIVAFVSLFTVAFAFVESSVVVYLRALYYPQGFAFPLKLMSEQHVAVELIREFSTIVMLAAVGIIAGSSRWQKFSYFLIAFGVWDLFYYIWLKALLDWPATLFDWDILFLIPVPWIGPVIAPVLVSLVMIAGGMLVMRLEERKTFHPTPRLWATALLATGIVLYTFIVDTGATLHFQLPQPYRYELFVAGLFFYGLTFFILLRRN